MRPIRAARPQLYGILGHPLRHSLSPVVQQAAFDHRRIAAAYLPFEVPPRQLRLGVRLVRHLGVRGLNVTVPFKEAILPYLDRIDPAAQRVGAVNTIVRRGTRLVGYNTDVGGFLDALPRTSRLRRQPVLLAGAGGAARAVLWALQQRGARHVVVVNRSQGRAQQFQRWARHAVPRMHVTTMQWRSRARWLSAHQPALIVNATSLGLHARDPLPIPVQLVRWPTIIMDLTYRRPTTALVARARRRGLLALDGRHMLLYQGARAFTLWTRRAAPRAVMHRALTRALQRNG